MSSTAMDSPRGGTIGHESRGGYLPTTIKDAQITLPDCSLWVSVAQTKLYLTYAFTIHKMWIIMAAIQIFSAMSSPLLLAPTTSKLLCNQSLRINRLLVTSRHKLMDTQPIITLIPWLDVLDSHFIDTFGTALHNSCF